MGLWSWINRHLGSLDSKNKHALDQSEYESLRVLMLPPLVLSEVIARADNQEEMTAVIRGLGAIRSIIKDEEKLWFFARTRETYPTLRRLATAKELSAEWLELTASVMQITTKHVAKMKPEADEEWNPLDEISTDGKEQKIRDLKWSTNPGCFERHLQRKYNNPLFPESERSVNQYKINQARERDSIDASKLLQSVNDILHDFAAIVNPCTGDVIDQFRGRIDNLLKRAAEIGGELSSEPITILTTIRTSLMESWRAGIEGNNQASESLRRAEVFNQARSLVVHIPFIAQMGRKDRPIKSEHMVPALLCESPETIRTVMSVMDGETRALVRQAAEEVAARVQEEGALIPLLEEKLRALDP